MRPMEPEPRKVSRPLVGFIALAMLAGGAALTITAGSGDDSQNDLWRGACVRVGLVMGAFWLALPTIQQGNRFARVLAIGGVGIVLLSVFLKKVPIRYLIIGGIAVMGLSLILRPRPKRRPGSRL